MKYNFTSIVVLIATILCSFSSRAMEDETGDVESPSISIPLESPGPIHLPSKVRKHYKCKDLDGCRLLFLANFDTARNIAVPEELEGTFAPPPGKSRKLSYYSGAVITNIGLTGVCAIIYMTFGACAADDEKDYLCLFRNAVVPTFLTSLGGIGANIIGQWVYDRRINRFEDLRNQAQNSNHKIKEIYANVAKFTMRTYLKNLLLAHEAWEQDSEEDLDEQDAKEEIMLKQVFDPTNAGWELALDKYLKEKSVTFERIIKGLENWDDVAENLAQMGVWQTTINDISAPFLQMKKLLCKNKPSCQRARSAIHTLVFVGTRRPHRTAEPIFDIITIEDLASQFDKIIKKRR